jgi:hypothetical protein
MYLCLSFENYNVKLYNEVTPLRLNLIHKLMSLSELNHILYTLSLFLIIIKVHFLEKIMYLIYIIDYNIHLLLSK